MASKDQRARMKKRIDRRKKRAASPRPKYELYLDKSRDEDAAVAETIEYLLNRNKFHPTARRGILIDVALQQGDISTLLRYYPQVLDLVKAQLPAPEPPDELLKRLDRIESKLDEKALPVSAPMVASGLQPLGGLGSMTGKTLGGFDKVAMPTFDDDDDDMPVITLKRDMNAGADVVANFLDAAFGTSPTKSKGEVRH